MDNAAAKLASDLGWSLWSELGVAGVLRNHAHVALDPEPLIVFSPSLFQTDARLRGEVMRWCASQADRISASRLHGLVKLAPREVSAAFAELAAALSVHGVRWTGRDVRESSSRAVAATIKPLSLPTARPALVRFRLRALAGVGARADVLAALLGRDGGWLVASDLHGLGYSKRNVARILAELGDSALVHARTERNTIAYRTHSPESWKRLVKSEGLAWPDWAAVFSFVDDIVRLWAQSSKSESVRRVAAVKAAQRFEVASDALGLERPPATRGMADAWDLTVPWAEAQLRGLVQGTSASMRVPD